MIRSVASKILHGVTEKLPDVKVREKHYGHEVYFSLNGKTSRIGEIFYDDDGNRCGGIGIEEEDVPMVIEEIIFHLSNEGIFDSAVECQG